MKKKHHQKKHFHNIEPEPIFELVTPEPIIPPKKNNLRVAGIIAFVLMVFVGFYLYQNTSKESSLYSDFDQEEIENYWLTQKDFYFDPMVIVRKSEDIALVDIRSKERFDAGHIKGSVSIPFPSSNSENKETLEQSFKQAFKKLGKAKTLVIYDENVYAERSLEAAFLLSESNIRVKVLRVGWNEFRHLTNFWVPEDLATKVNILDHVEYPTE